MSSDYYGSIAGELADLGADDASEAAPEVVDMACRLASVGAVALLQLGFEMKEPAEVQIHVGTDEHPDKARITLTWPLPPELPVAQD